MNLSWRSRRYIFAFNFILFRRILPRLRTITYFILQNNVVCETYIKSHMILPLTDTSPIYLALYNGSRGVSDVNMTYVDLYFVPCDTTCNLLRLHFKTNIARYSQERDITSRFNCLGQYKNTSLSEIFFLRTRTAVLRWIFFSLRLHLIRLLCFSCLALLNSRWTLGKYWDSLV